MDWKPGEDFCVRLCDKTNDARNSEQLEEMVERIRKEVNPYGFDILGYGSWASMKIVAKGEDSILKKGSKT